MDCKNALKSGIIAVTLLVAAFLTTQQLQVQASNNDNDDCRDKPFPQDVACAVGGGATGYDAGYSDGKRAGINGDGRSCPQSNGLSGYCVGWNDGYSDGADARRDVEQNRNSDDGEFEDNN